MSVLKYKDPQTGEIKKVGNSGNSNIIIPTKLSEFENDVSQLFIKDLDIANYGIETSLYQSDMIINCTIEELCAALPEYSHYSNGWIGTAKKSDGTAFRYGTLGSLMPELYGKLYVNKPRQNECDLVFIAYDQPNIYVSTWTTTNNYGFSGWRKLLTETV